jgi:hypothetical protein
MCEANRWLANVDSKWQLNRALRFSFGGEETSESIMFDQAAEAAVALFRFLRHQSKPNAPRPVANNVKAADLPIISTSRWHFLPSQAPYA